MTTSVYSNQEVGWAFLLACVVQGSFIALVLAVDSADSLVSKDTPPKKEIPISVTPMLDEIPLAKLGGKKVKYKLPDMWKKPEPVKRLEAKSAPTPKADKTPEAIPSSEPIKKEDDEEPPKPEDEVVKQAPDVPEDTKELKEEPNLPEEGFSDGYEEGKETDKLKAMWVSRYRIIVTNWLRQGFNVNGLDCSEVAGKSAIATVQVGPSGSVQGYGLGPSGAASLDERARAALEAKVGQQLPPPPDNLEANDVYNSAFSVKFNKNCP